MTIIRIAQAAGLALLACPAAGRAQEPPSAIPAPPRAADTSFTVGEIVVTARGVRDQPVATSIDRMAGNVAQAAVVDNAYQLIGRMPGIQVTDFGQGTTSGKFSMRGFNGEGTINAVKLLIDGIPANSNDGNMPYIDMVFPLEIDRIDVARGTADPRHGLHAIAGSANIATRTGGTYLDARAGIGSYATAEAEAAAGVERGGLTQNYHAAWRESDGFRAHARASRLSLSGKWGLATGGVRLTAAARHYEGEAQEPGYLTLAESRTDRRMTNAYNATDGGTRTMQRYALGLDADLSDRLSLSASAYHNRLRDDRHVRFSAGTSQQRRLTREDHRGLSAALRWRGEAGGAALTLEAGGDAEWQDNRSLRWLTAARVPTSQTRDQQFDLRVAGLYVMATIEPLSWLSVTPGYRADRVGGDFTDRLAGGTAPVNDYGTIGQPKLSVTATPADGVTLYGNWGRTFQIGLGSGAYLIPPRRTDLAPSINEGWELGARFSSGDAIEARVAWWTQTATGEIARKQNDPLGDFENLGATERKGVDVQARVAPVRALSLWGAISWQQAIVSAPPPATPQYAGNALDHVPHWLWSGGADWTPGHGLALSLAGRGQSAYHLTTANAQGRWGGMAVLDASATWRRGPAEFAVTVRNLADATFEYVWWDGAQTLHSPGAGRSVTASIRVRL